MPIRIQISLPIYIVVQGAIFGVGAPLVLATPLSAFAIQLLPWVVGVTVLVSIPVSYMIAPHLLARFESRFAPIPSSDRRL